MQERMARLSLSRRTLGLAALALLAGPSVPTAKGDIQYGQLPDNATPEDPLGLRNDPSLNFGETKGALGSRLTDGCNVKNAKYGHLFGCGVAVETPNGLNLGAGADVMADGSVKMGIGAGIGGEGFGAGCDILPDGSLHCGKGSSLLGQQGFVKYGDPAAQAIAAQAGAAARLAKLQGNEHVEVDPEYKPGTLHLNVDSHDFHEVITGHAVYVPPDLAAQQEAYYARKIEKRGAAPPVLAAVEATGAAAAPAVPAAATAEPAAPAVVAPVVPGAVAPETKAAAAVAANGDNPLTDDDLLPAPPIAPEPRGDPRTYTFQGVVPPPNKDARRAFEYPEGTPATVAGSIRLGPKLGVKLWHVAGATVVVNMTKAVLTYPSSMSPVAFPAADALPGEIDTPKVSDIKALDPQLLDVLYFFNATLALGLPDNLPTPLPERVARVAFTSGVTVQESVVAETGDEAFAASLPNTADPIGFHTMWILYGCLDDLTPVKQMAYAHMDLTRAVPVMNTVPAPKLLLQNVGVVLRRVAPTPEEVAADTVFLNPVAPVVEEEEGAEEAAAAPAPAAGATPAVVVEDPVVDAEAAGDAPAAAAAQAAAAAPAQQDVIALPVTETGELLPADQAPKLEEDDDDEDEAPAAPAPPRAADALPKGATANKSFLRAGGGMR